jgi:hypothetical protein
MLHTIAYELSGSEAALTALTPVPDPTIRVSGNDFFVPSDLNSIVYAAASINSAVATLRAQIQSPSLRSTLNYDISPIANGLVFGATPARVNLFNSPLSISPNEPLDMFVQNGGAVMNRGLLWLADGSIKPTSGKIYTVRFTTGVTMVTASWVNGAVTFGQTLPSGKFQIVGLRLWSANGVAARVFPIGAKYRPGVLMGNAEANAEWTDFRAGNAGVLGEFDNTTPPSFDFLGITDTAQVGFMDLIKTA